MKFTLIILTVLAPFFAHAGGGGGLRPGMQTMMMQKSPEFIFALGEKNGLVEFVRGQYHGQTWMVENVSLPVDELQLDPSTSYALDSSKILNSWIELK